MSLTVWSYRGALRQALAVDYARGQLAGTPLCMRQYSRMFTYYRRPGHTTDTQIESPAAAVASEPEHIIVACKNQVRASECVHVTPRVRGPKASGTYRVWFLKKHCMSTIV